MTFTAPCLARNRANRQARIRAAIDLLPDTATMTARIEAIYAQATEAEHLDGAQWYSAASDIATLVGDLTKTSPIHGAGIIAALSPQCSWDENIVRALALANNEQVGAFGDALAKAKRIHKGHHPLSVLGGRKVRSFFYNIAGHNGHVTIDRHAVAIVWGRPLSDTEIKVLERCGTYTFIAAVYRAVARKLNIAPPQLQAITWLAWRRIKGLDYVPEQF